jgi:ComF family protein
MKVLKTIFADTLHLFYPNICLGCNSDLIESRQLLCLRCLQSLPHTGFAASTGNPVEKVFLGRLKLEAAHSELYFTKNSLVQHLVHQLKYKGNTSIGLYLGQMLGKSLHHSNRFQKTDYLLPLPLHADKEKLRGYNQAEIICQGIASVMHIPIVTKNLIREKFSETQTKKQRIARWENVGNSFIVKEPTALKGKNILLVDDVLTTGATLEACGMELLKIAGVNLSIATLTIASH